MTDRPQCCGECAHFERGVSYKWGDCHAPLPKWVVDMPDVLPRLLFPGDGSDCQAFKRKEPSNDQFS